WLDRDVLIALHEDRAQAVEALRILEQLALLDRVADGRAVIRADVRCLLFRAYWRDHPPDFAAAHRRMAVYCRGRAAQAADDAQTGFRWARAAAYHEIAIQEITGWNLLASLFDHAEARGLAGTAQQVIDPMLELRPLLSSEERASLAYY